MGNNPAGTSSMVFSGYWHILAGNLNLIINGNPNVTSYDPVTGKELWAVECMSGDVAPSVAVNSTMVYSVTDYAKLSCNKTRNWSSIVWEDNTFTPDVSSPVATDEFLFVQQETEMLHVIILRREIHSGLIIFRISFMLLR